MTASVPDVWATALPAAALAGVIAVGVTLAIERWGGKTGGLLGSLPSTIVPASIGIFAGHDTLVPFIEAMDTTPAGMLVNGLFLWLWRVIPPRLPGRSVGWRLTFMSVLTLGLWLMAAWAMVQAVEAWQARGGSTLVVGATSLGALLVFGIFATWRSRPAPRGTRRVGSAVLCLRGLFAATAIGVAVWISGVAGGAAAGVASVFPAMFFTAMAALWLAQGEAVPAGAVGPMMLGSTSVGAYALLARWLVPSCGGPLGMSLAWLFAVLATTLPAWWWVDLRHRTARSAQG